MNDSVERISKPSARLEFRSRSTFNSQAWWAIALGGAALVYLAAGLGFQHVHNDNTLLVFNQITQQNEMPWYYDRPWYGAFVFFGLPALAFAWLFVTLKEILFRARLLETEVADLALHIQHTGYRLQSAIDALGSRAVSAETIS